MVKELKRHRIKWIILLFLGFVTVDVIIINKVSAPTMSQVTPNINPGKISVMAIGGSVAHGWVDTTGPGYLARAFQELSSRTKTSYRYLDRTIVGANGQQLATLYKGRYLEWLKILQPNIVVISWGLLNDALPNIPMDTFDFYIRQEITEALSNHATVLMVTPPITRASYTQFKKQEPLYVHQEISVAESFYNPNVVVCDVYDQMRSYLVSHHQSYTQYMGDGWHPNSAGHILAGHLLYQDLIHQFGTNPITYST